MTTSIFDITHQVEQADARCQEVKIITIDGPAGAGKTTLARTLSTKLDDCPVISMDSLYNGWQDALKPELWQRIYDQILEPYLLDKSASIQIFDWTLNQFTNWTTLPASPHLIIEGVGASHPFIANSSVLNIWIEADEELLLDRVLRRDGEQLRDAMVQWQLDEKVYFAEHSIKENADIHFSGM